MNCIRYRILSVALALLAGVATLSVASPASAATSLGGVDMQRACNVQHPGSTATVLNQTDAYSWRCVGGATYGINVSAACANQYWPGAYAGLGSTTNPYSWYCQGPACYGTGCVHVDPGATDCGGSNSTILEQVTVPGGGATIGLKWSAYCHANWARWVSGTSSPAYWNYWVETAGHPEGKTFSASEWTFMVNGNLLARACIQGNFDPNPACTGWH